MTTGKSIANDLIEQLGVGETALSFFFLIVLAVVIFIVMKVREEKE
jgi:hypothetical protein